MFLSTITVTLERATVLLAKRWTPSRQYRGYRDAISYAITRPEVDSERVGVWGTSFSGGLVLTVAAIDRRVKAVVSQVPFIDGYDSARWMVRPDLLGHLLDNLDADRANRFAGGEPATLPAVDPDPMAPSMMPDPEAWQWFSTTAAARAPRWKNEVTARSFDLISEFSPRSYVRRISPTPLLMIIARTDVCAPHEFAFEAYNMAREPKRLLITEGGHFGLYAGEGLAISSTCGSRPFCGAPHRGRRCQPGGACSPIVTSLKGIQTCPCGSFTPLRVCTAPKTRRTSPRSSHSSTWKPSLCPSST